MKTMIKRLFSPLALIAGALATLSTGYAQTTISGLPAITTVQSGTLVPVVDVSGTATTKKATVSQLVSGLPNANGTTPGLLTAANYNLLSGATNLATPSTLVERDGSGLAAFQEVTLNGSPVNPSDAATKAYVDAAASSLNIHTPVTVATTGSNITLSGGAPNTLDGVTLIVNNRVLVKDQSTNTQNGIYSVQTLGTGSNGTWVRASDANSGSNLTTGTYVFVIGGTVNASSSYVMTTTGTIVIGTSPIIWTQFAQVTQIQASNIIGQIVASQVAAGAIQTAAFATGIQPVSIVSSVPSPSGYTGPSVVYNTTDGQLYRYAYGAWTLAVPTINLSGQITTTQITPNSITTALIQAGAITSTQIAAGAVTAGQIAANAVTAGTIAAGAVSTSQLAAGAVNTAQLAAGAVTATQIAANTITAGQIAAGTITGSLIAANTITASNMNVSTLSAVSANLGTVTAGTLNASISISVGTGAYAFATSSSGTFFGDLGAGDYVTFNNALTVPTMAFYFMGNADCYIANSFGGIAISGINTISPLLGSSGGAITFNGGDLDSVHAINASDVIRSTDAVQAPFINAGGGQAGDTGGVRYLEGAGHAVSFAWTGTATAIYIDGLYEGLLTTH